MKPIRSLFRPLAVLFICLGGAGSLSASTIFWGSLFGDTLLTSSGTALDSSFTFELGNFINGFVPTAGNTASWALNWQVFDTAVNTDGWTPADQEIAHSVDHTLASGSTSPTSTPSAIFTEGAPAYLWAFNSKDVNTMPEWALLADNDHGTNVLNAWEFPDPTLQSGESFDWQTRDLDTAIFGGVNDLQGPGLHTASPATFTLQTHVVPEPSSALLLALAGGSLMRARRRT